MSQVTPPKKGSYPPTSVFGPPLKMGYNRHSLITTYYVLPATQNKNFVYYFTGVHLILTSLPEINLTTRHPAVRTP